MTVANATAAERGSIPHSGRQVDAKSVTLQHYLTNPSKATEISPDYPALAIGNRFRLTLQTARLVCELASIGGRFA